MRARLTLRPTEIGVTAVQRREIATVDARAASRPRLRHQFGRFRPIWPGFAQNSVWIRTVWPGLDQKGFSESWMDLLGPVAPWAAAIHWLPARQSHRRGRSHGFLAIQWTATSRWAAATLWGTAIPWAVAIPGGKIGRNWPFWVLTSFGPSAPAVGETLSRHLLGPLRGEYVEAQRRTVASEVNQAFVEARDPGSQQHSAQRQHAEVASFAEESTAPYVTVGDAQSAYVPLVIAAPPLAPSIASASPALAAALAPAAAPATVAEPAAAAAAAAPAAASAEAASAAAPPLFTGLSLAEPSAPAAAAPPAEAPKALGIHSTQRGFR